MKRRLFCLLVFLLYAIVLDASINETIDETIITTEWPALHKSLLKREFSKAKQILDIYPDEAQIYVSVNLPNLPEKLLCSYFGPKSSSDWYQDFKDNSNCQGKISKMTSLEMAISRDAPIEIIEMLITLGANVNHERLIGLPLSNDSFYLEFRTPLLSAFIKQNYEVIQLLLNSGANPEKVVYEGYGKFFYADYEYGRELDGIKMEGNWKNLNYLIDQSVPTHP